MNVLKIGMIGFISVSSPVVLAQNQTEEKPTPVVLNEQAVNSKVYHDYAIRQAQQKWGVAKDFSPEQQEVIKKIEALYAKLDKEYQQENINTFNRYQTFEQQPSNNDFYSQLNALYITDAGKSLIEKKTAFEQQKKDLFNNLSEVISRQPLLQVAIEDDMKQLSTQKDKS